MSEIAMVGLDLAEPRRGYPCLQQSCQEGQLRKIVATRYWHSEMKHVI